MGELNLLFIHGAGGTKSKWRSVEPLFSQIPYQNIDLPGHGTNNDEAVSSIEEMADKVNQYVKDNTVIVGHSMGGLVGLELAAQNSNVRGLVLASSFYEIPVHPKILKSFSDGEFPDSLFYASYGKNVNEELIKIEKQEKESMPVKIAELDFNACNNYQAGQDRLEDLKIPILAIYGDSDRLLPNGVGEKLQSANNHVQIRKIEDAGHYPPLEEAVVFSDLLKGFYHTLNK